MTSRHSVAVGDRFIRTGQPLKVYLVTRIDERPHHPAHARLVSLTPNRDEITIAVGTLSDRAYFMPAPPSAE
jgi:hypothetical protein